MNEIFPAFRFSQKIPWAKLCKNCGHTKKWHRNEKGTLHKQKDFPCQKLGCDCKKFIET